MDFSVAQSLSSVDISFLFSLPISFLIFFNFSFAILSCVAMCWRSILPTGSSPESPEQDELRLLLFFFFFLDFPTGPRSHLHSDQRLVLLNTGIVSSLRNFSIVHLDTWIP